MKKFTLSLVLSLIFSGNSLASNGDYDNDLFPLLQNNNLSTNVELSPLNNKVKSPQEVIIDLTTAPQRTSQYISHRDIVTSLKNLGRLEYDEIDERYLIEIENEKNEGEKKKITERYLGRKPHFWNRNKGVSLIAIADAYDHDFLLHTYIKNIKSSVSVFTLTRIEDIADRTTKGQFFDNNFPLLHKNLSLERKAEENTRMKWLIGMLTTGIMYYMLQNNHYNVYSRLPSN